MTSDLLEESEEAIIEPGHHCPYCDHIAMQINEHFAHIEFEHPGKPLI